MKIKVSKVFANFVNEVARKNGKSFEASVVGLSERGYIMRAGVWSDPWIDYNSRRGTFDALFVCYPSDFYACSKYVGTGELTREFRRRGCRTVSDLEAMILDMFEI